MCGGKCWATGHERSGCDIRSPKIGQRLKADLDSLAIALAYEVSTKKVEQLKKRFVEEGFDAAVYRKPVTNVHRRKMTGDEEAHLIALFCSQAPEGHERWTLRMLADKMVELDIVDSVSHETIRQT